MKQKITALILTFSLFSAMLCACSSEKQEPATTGSTEAANAPVTNTEEEMVIPPDYEDIYSGVLESFCKLIDTDNTEFEGVQSVREAINTGKSVGYTVMDISADDVPELIIGANTDNNGSTVTEIYAVYTCVNGKPFFAFEGSARSCYMLKENGELFYSGSDGAMRTSFGLFVPEKDGASLICREFWFSTEKKDSPEQQVFYRNTNGSFAAEASEEQIITADEFEEKKQELQTGTVATELTELKWLLSDNPNDYADKTPAKITLGFAPSTDELPEAFREFEADTSEYAVKVIFRTDKKVTSFKLLKLTFEDVDENGKISFATEELTKLDVFTPAEPFLAAVSFPGSIPSYGISYIDADGTLKCFTVTESGMDGSLLLTEF